MQTKGVLHLNKSQSHYHLEHFVPSPLLSIFVEQYWHVSWDLTDKTPHTQKNLPHPNIHITFENDQVMIYGPVKHQFRRTLSGKGSIFGIKFTPASFFLINQSPVSNLTDKVIPLNALSYIDKNVKPSTLQAALKISANDQVDEKISCANLFMNELLSNYLVPKNAKNESQVEKICYVNTIINLIENDQSITKVAQVCQHFEISIRSLQRLFNTYIGVSPKWLIRKYRIHNILEQLEQQTQPRDKLEWQHYVAHLEYVDQAHFIKDFKSFIGCTPEQYIKRNQV